MAPTTSAGTPHPLAGAPGGLGLRAVASMAAAGVPHLARPARPPTSQARSRFDLTICSACASLS
eukprot:11176500-Alexandrium_andersonii.AAC.1